MGENQAVHQKIMTTLKKSLSPTAGVVNQPLFTGPSFSNSIFDESDEVKIMCQYTQQFDFYITAEYGNT